MGLVRKVSWETVEYPEFLQAREAMAFAWGGNDCALFAADGVLALTGVDLAEEFRGKYTDETGAWTAIKAVCSGSTVADAAVHCAERFGLREWPQAHAAKLAQRGDLVTLMDGGREIAGLVHLSGRHAVVVGEQGLKRIALTAVTRAWHY